MPKINIRTSLGLTLSFQINLNNQHLSECRDKPLQAWRPPMCLIMQILRQVVVPLTPLCGVLLWLTCYINLSYLCSLPSTRQQGEESLPWHHISHPTWTWSCCTDLVKVRNDEWVGARPSVDSTVLLWMWDIARPKGIATEKDSSIREGSHGLGFGLEAHKALLREGEVVVCDVDKGIWKCTVNNEAQENVRNIMKCVTPWKHESGAL
jgi:hypothetical protein